MCNYLGWMHRVNTRIPLKLNEIGVPLEKKVGLYKITH